MARAIRIEYEGAVYHVTARGNERRDIYRSDGDRQLFVKTLEEMVRQFRFQLFAYCLMGNHYHLIVGTPEANLSRGIGWLQTTYTVRYNHKYRRVGHLFQGRYKAQLVEKQGYAEQLLLYVHLNPARIGLKKGEFIPSERWEALQGYLWSSHRYYGGWSIAPSWMDMSWRSYFGREKAAAQKGYRKGLRRAFKQRIDSPWDQMRNGLALGDQEFVERIKELVRKKQKGEEQKWLDKDGKKRRVKQVNLLVKAEKDRRLKIWLQVRLKGEPMVRVAEQEGYRDGAGVHQVLRRLEHQRQIDKGIDKRLKGYEKILKLAPSFSSL